MHGGGGLIPGGGYDPTQTPEGAKASVEARHERVRRLHRMDRWERWLFTALASVIALGVLASVVLSAM